MSALPRWASPVDLGVPAVIAMFGFRPRRGTISVTTLLVRGGTLSMLMLESDETLGDECAEGLTKLGADVALALDGVALAEDRLVRLWQWELPAAPQIVMSVNLSPRQLQHPALVEDIARILRETGLAPERLEPEITESAVMEDPDAARTTLQKPRDLGISLAIADFGTGYPSLGYLKRSRTNSFLKLSRRSASSGGRKTFTAREFPST